MAGGRHSAGAPRHVRRVLAGLLGLAALAEVGAGVTVAASPGAPVSRHPGASAVGRARPPVTAADPARVLAAREKAATAVLAARARAVLARDPAGFKAGLDPEQPALVAQQLRVFANLRGVPLTTFSYDVDGPAKLAADRRRALGGDAWLATVTLHYSLRGFDAHPTAEREYLTFVERAGRWYVGGTADGAASGLHATRDLWDFGPVVAVRTARALVLGHPHSPVPLKPLAAEATADVPRVSAFWGAATWSQRVVLLVPADARETAALVGEGDLDHIAAVATAELAGDHGERTAVGDRIIVNPDNFTDLGPAGRRVVVTHEITHVATRAATGVALPDWLIEGIADYVGFRGTGITTAAATRELRAEVAADGVPVALPANADFSGDNPHLSAAYEEAWLACRMIADDWGPATLAQLYRTLGAQDQPASTQVTDAAVTQVLGVSLDELTRRWRAEVAAVTS